MNPIKIRPLSCGNRWIVSLPSGATATIELEGGRHDYRPYHLIGDACRYGSLRLAVEAAIEADPVAPLAPLPIDPVELLALARAAEDSIDVATKTIARLLRERTGRAWSVTRGRGTAYSWLTITAPPKRRAQFGHLSVDDQALLSAALGGRVHCQGESVRPCSGVHGSYVFRAAGHPVPEDWRIAAPSWD